MTFQRCIALYCAVLVRFLSLVHSAEAQPQFIPLGQLPGDGSFKLSQATDVSADGSVVAGSANVGPDHREAFRWTLAEGMVGIGDLPGGSFFSEASAVSPDGDTVVGNSVSATAQESMRWTAADGMSTLGLLPGSPGGFSLGTARDVADEGTIVGYSVAQGNNIRAYRWTSAEGMVSLGTLPGGSSSDAFAVTPDGSVIVGLSHSANGQEAFRWTAEGGMIGLGDLPGGEFYSWAHGVSADGSVVVGFSRVEPVPSSVQENAFRWTAATGMVSLGDIPGGAGTSQAYDVSADGSVVVGRASRDSRFYATRWNAVSGMQPIEELLTAAGINVNGWQLEHAEGISADGNVIVGIGTNPSGVREAWLVSGLPVPEPSGGVLCLAAAALLCNRSTRRAGAS
jgi:probable HAF family extracellular repeat protein